MAGTHGKTTTASMLSLVLVEAGLRPSFLIGGDVNEIGTNAAWDDGRLDRGGGRRERRHVPPPGARRRGGDQRGGRPPRPLRLVRRGAHGVRRLPGRRRPAGGRGGRPRGAGGGAGRRRRPGRRARRTPPTGWSASTRPGARSPSTSSGPDGALPARLQVAVPGLHNARNAAVATVAALAAGAPSRRRPGRWPGSAAWPAASSSAASTAGSPSWTTTPTCPPRSAPRLAAARNGGWRRVVAVFQPHRYSRTAEVGAAFGDAFADADVVVVTDVYSAGEAPVPGVSGRLVADAVRAAPPRSGAALRARAWTTWGGGRRRCCGPATCA